MHLTFYFSLLDLDLKTEVLHEIAVPNLIFTHMPQRFKLAPRGSTQ